MIPLDSYPYIFLSLLLLTIPTVLSGKILSSDWNEKHKVSSKMIIVALYSFFILIIIILRLYLSQMGLMEPISGNITNLTIEAGTWA